MAFLALAVKLKRYQALLGMDTLSLISGREMGEIICFYSDCLAQRGGLEAPLPPCPLHSPFQGGAKSTLWALPSGSHMANLLRLISGRDSEHQSLAVITLPRSQSMDNGVGIAGRSPPPRIPGGIWGQGRAQGLGPPQSPVSDAGVRSPRLSPP